MSPLINILLSGFFFGGGGWFSPFLLLFPAGGMELRGDFWKLGLAGEASGEKVGVANGAKSVICVYC